MTTRTTTRPTQKDIMQHQVPLEPTLKHHGVASSTRCLDDVKDLHVCRSPISTHHSRHILEMPTRRDQALHDRVVINSMPTVRVRSARHGAIE